MVNWWCVVCKNSDDNVDHFATALLSSSYGFMEFYICSFWSEVGDAWDGERSASMLALKFQDYQK